MKARIYNLWFSLRSSFWFVPSIMVVASIGMALVTMSMDTALTEYKNMQEWLIYTGRLEGARSILSTIAYSMIPVAGVVFSITIVALSLASSQFGPRLIWNFMHDLGNQVVLGTFVSTFMYCLIILANLQAVNEEKAFLPYVSITVAILLAMASLGVLIYFIHHVSASIHANKAAANVWRDLKHSIQDFFPEEYGPGESATDDHEEKPGLLEDFEHSALPVKAPLSGYLQSIDFAALMKIAVDHDLVLRIEYRAGHFIAKGNVLALVWPTGVDENTTVAIRKAFIMGNWRTMEQDVEFAVHQLVELAVRALSPGINDPFTAITCMDWLGAALSDVAGRKMRASYHYDTDSRLRIATVPFTFTGMIDAAFNQIRQYGQSSPSVLIHLLETIGAIATHAHRKSDLQDLARHAAMIQRTAREKILEELDLQDVERRYEIVVRALLSSDSGKRPLATGRKAEIILQD